MFSYEEQLNNLNKQLLRNFCKDSAEHFFLKGGLQCFASIYYTDKFTVCVVNGQVYSVWCELLYSLGSCIS